jgi:hypothetical protein
MSFYEPVSAPQKRKVGNTNFRYGSDYKNNPKNLDGKREDLFEEFWERINSLRTFHEGQKKIFHAFFEDKAKYIFMRMGRKATKTTNNIVIAWGYSLLVKNSTCFVTLPTITQAIEVYWDEKRLQWCDMVDTELYDLFVKSVDNNKHTINFINGSTIKLSGTWSEARGRGTQPNLLIADEIQDCSAEYLDAMEPNLAAKEDARCIMSGTPPKKKNHYHVWEDRILKNPQGITFKYSSYINTALPHLKGWLDNKKEELILAGKEDVWLREYMAEDCFSSDERVLPDVHIVDFNDMVGKLRGTDPSAFSPLLGIAITNQKLCVCYALTLQSRYTGIQFWILETETKVRLWDKSYHDIYSEIEKKMDEYSKTFSKNWRKVIYDETESFTDIIPHITQSRKDLKWKNRGIPLLKEMILNEKANISTRADQFAVEAQNLLKEDNILDYPTVCTMAMLANEYYQSPSIPKDEQMVWDQFAPLREAGLICYPPKKKGKTWVSHNWG